MFIFLLLIFSFFRSTSPRMAYCPAVFTTIGDDASLQASWWADFLSRWTPEELEWIKKMLEAHPDTTEKVLLVTAGSLSTWLGPMFLRWSRDFLVSVIWLNKPFLFAFHNASFIFRRTFFGDSRSGRNSLSAASKKPSGRGVTSFRNSAISRPVNLQVSLSLWLLT